MRSAIRLLVFTFLCGLLSGADDTWLRIKSPHFELFTTVGQRDGRSLIRRFEQVRSFFTQALGMGLSGFRPVSIIAFKSDKEFQQYSPRDFGTAFYLPGFRREFIVMKGGESQVYIAAVHEYTHLLVKQTGTPIPLWLNEGLAEFYSTIEETGGRIVVGKAVPNIGYPLTHEKWIDLRAIFAAGRDSALYNEEQRASMFYAESWALTHMLFEASDYKPRTPEMLRLLIRGAEAGAAIEQAYGKPLDNVQSELREYIRSNSLTATAFDLKWDKAADTPDITEDAPAALVALAEMLSQSEGQRAKSLALYEQLAQKYPKRWEVEAGWGSALFYGRETDLSLKHLAKAVELGCDDPAVFIDYRRALLQKGRDKDAIAALRSGIQAIRENGDLHRELAIALTQSGEYKAALLEFEKVDKVNQTDAGEFYYNAGYAHYRVGDAKRSLQLLELAVKYASQPGMKKAIEDLKSVVESGASPGAVRPPSDTLPEVGPMEDIPRTQRRQADDGASAHVDEILPPKLPVIEGVLNEVQCMGQTARLRIAVDGIMRTYAILDANNIKIHTGDGKPVEFACGPGQSRRIRIEYEPVSDGEVAGNLSGIEFF